MWKALLLNVGVQWTPLNVKMTTSFMCNMLMLNKIS